MLFWIFDRFVKEYLHLFIYINDNIISLIIDGIELHHNQILALLRQLPNNLLQRFKDNRSGTRWHYPHRNLVALLRPRIRILPHVPVGQSSRSPPATIRARVHGWKRATTAWGCGQCCNEHHGEQELECRDHHCQTRETGCAEMPRFYSDFCVGTEYEMSYVGKLTVTMRVDGTSLLPVCFGYHPYFQIDNEKIVDL
jgi:hypothetical protein